MPSPFNRTALGQAAESWGANFGIVGALLLAMAVPASKWGWVLFLGSNIAWLVFAHILRHRKLFLQTMIFTLSSVLGILNSFLPGNVAQRTIQHLLQ